ncbi:beta-ketoacyl synthase N-terminal-like domain-containing protein [Rhizobium helianthi]|uniref:Beta-ketoacyl synthase N-terminal-like domain-containing protein n=1 Tax=Rhizobium helianthi TaxID=1132695 RepID=A0ABW4M504_9HYPH
MSRATKVWVTGLSLSSALGSDVDAVWRALLDHTSGIAPLDCTLPLRGYGAAVLPDVPQTLPVHERQIALTASAIAQALAHAGLEVSDPRIVPILGTSYGGHLDAPSVGSLSDWAVAAVRRVGCIRSPVTIATACSAGADAIAAGLSLLRSGVAEICVCGGADVLTLAKRLGHSRLGTLASGDLRAFDQDRDGTVLGEGAAFLVLETAHSARARGVAPLGVFSGAGASSDAASAVAPDVSGRNVVLAVQRAVENAGIALSDVSVINAHASGTAINDATEANAYGQLFGSLAEKPAVFATKGNFGHTLGATGALEAVAVLQALSKGCVPPIYRLERPLADLHLPLPIQRSISIRPGAGISTTLGFGGFNTCLVFEGVEAA